MEEKHAAFGSGPNEDLETTSNANNNVHGDHGWQKVTYAKRRRTNIPNNSESHANNNKALPNGALNGADNVFRSLEQQSEDSRRRILEAQRAANAGSGDVPARSKQRSHYEDAYEDDSDAEPAAENGKSEDVKKVKPKKPKKPKVTVAEAAAKIDEADLAAFLADISASYESQQDVQLMRFADYFGRAFSAVNAAQFPWVKMFRESAVAKIADTPLSHISDAVYKTSVDWINQRSLEALGAFLLWSLDSILSDLASQHAGGKGSKKGALQVSSKSQVAIFVVVAMVLRRKPDVLINLLATLRENSKYQGQDKLPLLVWMFAQASKGDLSVGLYAWGRNLLPILSGKGGNPQSRDLVLQLVEKILSSPKARPILVNGAVRRGERLLPPFAFEILLRFTFPASSARVKATERFEAIYPILKEVALAGSPGSKAMKQVAQQIFPFAIKAAGESIPELSQEATNLVIWSLTQTSDGYKQWEKVYLDNLEASVFVLKKLSDDWKEHSRKLSLDPLREMIKNIQLKNEKALASKSDVANQALYKDALKYCKILLGRLTRSHGCVTFLTITAIALAVGAVFMSPDMESWNLKKLSVVFNSQLSF